MRNIQKKCDKELDMVETGSLSVSLSSSPHGKMFRDILESPNCVQRLVSIARGQQQPLSGRSPAQSQGTAPQGPGEKLPLQSMAVRIVSTLVKYNDAWIAGQAELVAALHDVWLCDEYHDRQADDVMLGGDPEHWPEAPLLARVLLRYFHHHPFESIELLFGLTKAFLGRTVANYQFLQEYLEEDVARKLPVAWARAAFFTFAELHESAANCTVPLSAPQGRQYPFLHLPEARASIIHRIIMPCFTRCFNEGLTDELVGTKPEPESESADDLVAVYVKKVGPIFFFNVEALY
jgi:hypothetical protein